MTETTQRFLPGDLEKVRAANNPPTAPGAERSRPQLYDTDPAGLALERLRQDRTYRQLPHPDTLTEHDPHLARLIAAKNDASSAADRSINHWRAGRDGAARFAAAVAAEVDAASRDETSDGALAALITGRPAEYVAAARAVGQANRSADAVTRYLAEHGADLGQRLAPLCTTTADSTAVHYLTALDNRDAVALAAGDRSNREWEAIDRLHDWVTHPGQPYDPNPRQGGYPAGVGYLRTEAAQAITPGADQLNWSQPYTNKQHQHWRKLLRTGT